MSTLNIATRLTHISSIYGIRNQTLRKMSHLLKMIWFSLKKCFLLRNSFLELTSRQMLMESITHVMWSFHCYKAPWNIKMTVLVLSFLSNLSSKTTFLRHCQNTVPGLKALRSGIGNISSVCLMFIKGKRCFWYIKIKAALLWLCLLKIKSGVF